jgi:uncharacterized protein YegL
MAELEQKNFNNEEIPTIKNASEPHMALVFLLDTSRSMEGDAIRNLNEGLNRFKIEVCERNKQTKDILDVAIIEFNSNYRVVQDFVPIEYMDSVNLTATGGTNMSPAIREALKMVDERSRFYRRTGTEPYKPWVILVSDGAPGDDINEVTQEIKAMEKAGLVSFRSLGVEGYDSNILHTLCDKKVMKLEGYDFTSFFDWVNKSMRSVSQSSPGEKPVVVQTEGNVLVDRNPDWD